MMLAASGAGTGTSAGMLSRVAWGEANTAWSCALVWLHVEMGRSSGSAVSDDDVGAACCLCGDSGCWVDGVVSVAVAVAVGVASESPSVCQCAVVLSVSLSSLTCGGGSGVLRWALSWAWT